MYVFGLVAVVGVMLGLRRPLWGVGLAIAGAPAYLIRTDIFGIPTTLLEVGVIGVIIGYAFRSGRRIASGEPVLRTHWQDLRQTVPAMAMIGVGLAVVGWIAATVVSIDPRSSLGALKAWLIEPLLLGLIVVYEAKPHTAQTVIGRALMVTLIWVSFAGLVQLVGFPETIEGGRISSVFAPVANYFAMLIAPLTVVALGCFALGHDRRFAGVAFASGLIGLILSVSFGGLIAFAAGALVIILAVLSPLRRKQALLGLIASGIVILIAAAPTRYFQEKLNFSTRSSSLVRTEIWRTAASIGRDHPFFGIGPGAFEDAYREAAPAVLGHAPLEWLVAKPHNLYLNLWIETGVLGLAGALVFFGSSLRRMLRGRTMSSVIAAGLVAMLVHGMVDTTFFKNDLAVIASVMIAFGLTRARSTAE